MSSSKALIAGLIVSIASLLVFRELLSDIKKEKAKEEIVQQEKGHDDGRTSSIRWADMPDGVRCYWNTGYPGKISCLKVTP